MVSSNLTDDRIPVVELVDIADIDRHLDVTEEEFACRLESLVEELERGEYRIANPTRPSGPDPLDTIGLATDGVLRSKVRKPSSSLLATYRGQISHIPHMTREEEVRLSKRVEFFKARLERALEQIQRDDLAMGVFKARRSFECETPDDADGQISPETTARIRRMCCEFDDTRNEMIERSLHLVLRLIDRYRGLGVSTLDLIQEGNSSLFKAVEGFDWRRGVRFRTYATYWVNQAFLNLIYNASRTVRVPAYIQKAMKKINDARVRVGQQDPQVADLAQEAKLPQDLVRSALDGNRYSLSLDRELDGQEGRTAMDLVEDPEAQVDTEALEEISLPDQLEKAMEALTDRERQVLHMRYGLAIERTYTLAEVGEVLGVSLERVRQIQEAALAKLRGPRGRRLLTHFTS